MTKMKFDTIEIDDRFIEEVKVWSKESSQVIEHCLSNNIWIAGGFARKIAHMYFNINEDKDNLELPYQRIVNYFKQGGDIDIFTKIII